jgi:hypothetical protein
MRTGGFAFELCTDVINLEMAASNTCTDVINLEMAASNTVWL